MLRSQFQRNDVYMTEMFGKLVTYSADNHLLAAHQLKKLFCGSYFDQDTIMKMIDATSVEAWISSGIGKPFICPFYVFASEVFISQNDSQSLKPGVDSGNADKGLLCASIDNDILSELCAIIDEANNIGPLTTQTPWFQLVRAFTHPFFILWGAFSSEWLFDLPTAITPGLIGRLPLHVIPRKRLRVLCSQLLETVLISESPLTPNDLLQFAEEDGDCRNELLYLLRNRAVPTDRATCWKVPRLIELLLKCLKDIPRPLLPLDDCCRLLSHCIGIGRGVCVNDPLLYPLPDGSIKAFGTHCYTSVNLPNQVYKQVELLVSDGDLDTVCWLPMSEFKREMGAKDQRYQAITASVSESRETEYLSCFPDKARSMIHIFSLAKGVRSLSIPTGLTSNGRRPGPLHVLVVKINQSEGAVSGDAYWYGSVAGRLCHVISGKVVRAARGIICEECNIEGRFFEGIREDFDGYFSIEGGKVVE
ncbi:hypothetical protein JAAARDRAFT_49853 [Jaapia argillacea MUCL 33604]|uniref:Uncharacterized protein n=1 Tax=Jaapia argillacea MUCL 33604 TaxID=933084 RepID=A0A067PF44_9AGAM|nr:hypothetical protein JAAARDRAFT_49853 [Jaapia argillacea MUCL 33604]